MNYEQRVVVYLDILGFKELIDGTLTSQGKDNETGIQRILDLYGLIFKNWDLPQEFTGDSPKHESLGLAKENAESGKIVTIFSDTIVISFPQTTRGEIFWTIMELRLLLMELANRGFFCRGAISAGKLIHNDKIIFGPALVEAYLLESKKAIFPRVLVPDSVIDVAQKPFARQHKPKDELEYLHDMLIQDYDGFYYIDFLERVQGDVDEPEFGYCDYLIRVRQNIEKGMKIENERVKEKFNWLKEKFNNTVKIIRSAETINNLKKQGRQDLISYYSVLESI
jgi:hypothetical protein